MSAACATGCSADTLIWGSDGAHVIEVTERIVADLASGGGSELVCADSEANLGATEDWQGLAAGEPEQFVAAFWDEQVALDPQWSINLEGLPDGATPGDEIPGDLFYRQSDDGLCLIDVAWSTLAPVG